MSEGNLTPNGLRPSERVTVRVGILQILFDALVGSMDWGSGFLCQEDINALRYTANILGVCPQSCTPCDMRHKYPECEGVRAWREGRQAAMPGWVPSRNSIGHNEHTN